MRLAGDDTILEIESEAVRLRPSLRAAMRLERHSGGYQGLLKAIGDGSVLAFSAVIAECSDLLRPERFLLAPGPEPIGDRLGRITPPIVALVLDLADVAPPSSDRAEAKPTGETITLGKAFAELFGIATGVLGWPPADAWSATPAEIWAALEAHVAMLRAQHGVTDEPEPRLGPDNSPLDSAGLAALAGMNSAA